MPAGPRPYTLRGAQILAIHELNGQPCVCGVDFVGPLGWERPALVNVLNTFVNSWAGNVMANVSFSCTFIRGEARGLRGPNDFIAEFAVQPPTPGDVADPAKDGQQAVVIAKRTAVAGKSGRGRVFIPGLPGGALTNGLVAQSFRQDLADALQAVTDAVKAAHAGWLPVVISYIANYQWRAQPATYEITSWETRTAYPGSMNGRRPD